MCHWLVTLAILPGSDRFVTLRVYELHQYYEPLKVCEQPNILAFFSVIGNFNTTDELRATLTVLKIGPLVSITIPSNLKTNGPIYCIGKEVRDKNNNTNIFNPHTGTVIPASTLFGTKYMVIPHTFPKSI